MQSKILTVTIPTWNRVKLLEELLSELIKQIVDDNLQAQVELLISNNGSEDETENLVLSLKLRHDFISYNNNGVNKGARYNVLKCMELVSGEYLILFGDDDRPNKGALKNIVNFLETNRQAGFVYDSHIFKKNPFGNAIITLPVLLENFYYYLGNAGLFIVRSAGIKDVLNSQPYDYFSPTWPQTQLFILASQKDVYGEIHIADLNVLSAGKHDEVMIYSSYYLWRTTYLDFIHAIEGIRDGVDIETYLSAKKYFKNNVSQLFFNILQCGVFLDKREVKNKTAGSIFKNLSKFSIKEMFYLILVVLVLFLPSFISKVFSNAFIFMTRGKKGLEKKNRFVDKEQQKQRKRNDARSNEIREFDFKNV